LRDGDLIAIGQHELRFLGPDALTRIEDDQTRREWVPTYARTGPSH
jgi:hypothetical protein